MGRTVTILSYTLVAVSFCAASSLRAETTFTFAAPAGSNISGSGSVNASASFLIPAAGGQVTITLSDLLASPHDAGLLVSDLEFTLSGLTAASTLSSSSATQTITGVNMSTVGATGPTAWSLFKLGGGLILCTVCPGGMGGAAPKQTIIGTGPYGNVNSSITNGTHSPFLDGSATFTVTNSSIISGTTIDSAIFSFGSTFGSDIAGVPVSVAPEPKSMLLFGTGLLAIAGIFRRRLRKNPAAM